MKHAYGTGYHGSFIGENVAEHIFCYDNVKLTRSILLYVESIQDARRFMSAARASARSKPILVIRPRRLPCELRDAAADLTEDDLDLIYDAAFRRAGMVRVDDIDLLFEGARTLAN